jgi:DNA processing protein
MEDREVLATIALSLVPGVGAQRLRTLMAMFGSAVTKLGARVLLAGEPEFPEQLIEIPEAPVVLYCWGDLTLMRRPIVAMVGSRDHTEYGGEAARLLAHAVATRAVVVSGMARGIDAIVHIAALDAGGGSIGVLGNGLGVVYPQSNRALYDRMVTHGLLVTEHPPFERPHQGSFSRRNRLISGLARVVVVVEARSDSGALVTAHYGADQGRDVMAVPGGILSRTSAGCNKLIQQGAKLVMCAADILEELGLATGMREFGLALSTPAPRVPPLDLSGLQLTLWERMTTEPQHVDALVSCAQTAPADVLGALTELELRGLVRQGPGMVFGLT